MASKHVFISHASADDGFVRQLRVALEDLDIPVWADSRQLVGGNKLAAEIDDAIEQARQVLVVLSPDTVNSAWVRKEIEKALEVEEQHKDDGYRVIPLLLPGIRPSALPNWFEDEPVGVPIDLETAGLTEALPAVLATLGKRLPDDPQPVNEVAAAPLEELVLELSEPAMVLEESGERRATATATIRYEPANTNIRPVVSERFTFRAPLGPIELDDLRWYLERYYRWPTGVFAERANDIEDKLPSWGQHLHTVAFGDRVTQTALSAWRATSIDSERRFSVQVDRQPSLSASERGAEHGR